jgi:hypothetical protein
MAKPFESDPGLISEHRCWLSSFDQYHSLHWEKLLTANPEAAECEAAVRRLLQQNGSSVEPHATPDGSRPSPDFHCRRSGRGFFVEAACITVEQASDITGLTAVPQHADASYYAPMTQKIWDVCKKKTPQCCNLDQPVLLAVGTFHYNASARCLCRQHAVEVLIGIPRITQVMDMTTGKAKGAVLEHTDLNRAAFFKSDDTSELDYARQPVSAILLCGFGSTPPEVRGALHPSPVHVFDRTLLSAVEFCRLRHDSGCLSAEWI